MSKNKNGNKTRIEKFNSTHLAGLTFYLVVVALAYVGSQRVIAQTDSSGAFLTYTNVSYGFTMKYPPDWRVNDTSTSSVRFTSPDHFTNVLVHIGNQTSQTGRSLEEAAKLATAHPPTGFTLLELNANNYFLSGHPALRIVGVKSFWGSNGIPPFDVKAMSLVTYLGGKAYQVTYGGESERYSTNLQTGQEMIGSFQIIRGG